MQHDLRHSPSQENAHGRMAGGTVGQYVYKARDLAVDADPVFHRRPGQAGGVSDGRDVQQ